MKSKISKIALVNIELTMSEDEVLKLQKAIKKKQKDEDMFVP
jgi:hypothetical protein